MKHTALAILLCATVAACAPRSVATMEKMPTAYTSTTKKSASAFTRCLLPKVENYPLWIGFSFEDRTAIAHTRDTEGGADIYQMQNSEMMTLVTWRRAASGNRLALYVANNHFAAARIRADYARLIDTCR